VSPTLPARLFLSAGLSPFIAAREFKFYCESEYQPLLRIECTSVDISYVLVDPRLVVPEYEPQFSVVDLDAIGLAPSQHPLVFAIVNLKRGPKHATINLVGPLIVNPETGVGRQAIPMNAQMYSSRHSVASAT
jgi:flagellar assembly factor FliW